GRMTQAPSAALGVARSHLLNRLGPEGFWEGRLATSALSTAVALGALSLVADESDAPACAAAVAWLRAHRNADGGWGDTTASPSNLPTTLLVASAFRLAGTDVPPEAQAWLVAHGGDDLER